MTGMLRKKNGFGLQTYGLMLAFILGLGAYYTVAVDHVIEHPVGASAIAAKKADLEARQALLSLQHAGSISLEQALYDTGKGVGSCEDHYGYPLATGPGDDCFPTAQGMRQSVISATHKNLFDNILNHNGLNPYISADAYTLSWQGSLTLKAATDESIVVPIIDEAVLEQEQEERLRIQQQESSAVTMAERARFTSIRPAVHCEGSCLLVEEAYERLLEANDIARDRGFEIYVESSYRPLSHQKQLWAYYADRYPDPEVRDDYVCNPHEPNAEERCTHISGKAVDVWISGKEKVEMTPEDWQRIEDVMAKAGWVRYAREEWHFEYGTRRWQLAQEKGVSVHG